MVITMVHCSYESQQLLDPQKETVRSKFAGTILFVEDYLCHVRSMWSSKNREQPKLTYQVKTLLLVLFLLNFRKIVADKVNKICFV